MARGFFLTLEGIEGAGKSSLVEPAAEFLRAHYPAVVCTREPGGTPLGEAVRDLLLREHGPGIGARAECLLFAAARAQHLEERIAPALQSGAAVICDRYADSTSAYQGAGRGLARRGLEELRDWLAGPLRPDLTLLLDLPVEEGLRRSGRRGNRPDRFDLERISFHRAVRACYLELAAAEPDRIRCLDASGPLPAVLQQLRATLEQALHAGPSRAAGVSPGDSGPGL